MAGKFEDDLERWWRFTSEYEQKVKEAASTIHGRIHQVAVEMAGNLEFGVVLGSGLGGLADKIDVAYEIPYSEIPNFPDSTVPGHEGTMIIGRIEDVPIIGLKGRKHYYEGADLMFNAGILQAVFPVHVLAELDVKNYFVTNAAGGLNKGYLVGDAMIIKSHINLIPSPLMGRQMEFGRVDSLPYGRFVPMHDAYDLGLTGLLLSGGGKHHERMQQGVYAAVPGPQYENVGEVIALRQGMRADAVGMSTAPEVIAARSRGMRCVGISCITNIVAPDGTNTASHEEVKAILESPETKGRFADIVAGFFQKYREKYMLGK